MKKLTTEDFEATVKRCADWSEKISAGAALIAFLNYEDTATLWKAATVAIILFAASIILTLTARRF